MAIPDFQTIMLPLLKMISDGREYKNRDLIDKISKHFELSEEERREQLPSGTQAIIDNRVGWAKTYMLKAGLLSSPKRGTVRITEKGLEILEKEPKKINIKFLEQFPAFQEFRTLKKDLDKSQRGVWIKGKEKEGSMTPDELIEKGYKSINTTLAQEVLDKLRSVDPYFFEGIVGKLLDAMGYGRFKPTPNSGDKGIDGIVYQDKLGLEKIFFQAKRYKENNSVTASDVRDFVGTLDLHGVNKGIFITTSKFPQNTENILQKTPKNIILVNGLQLAELMIDHDVGVSTQKTYKIKNLDSDFFPEE